MLHITTWVKELCDQCLRSLEIAAKFSKRNYNTQDGLVIFRKAEDGWTDGRTDCGTIELKRGSGGKAVCWDPANCLTDPPPAAPHRGELSTENPPLRGRDEVWCPWVEHILLEDWGSGVANRVVGVKSQQAGVAGALGGLVGITSEADPRSRWYGGRHTDGSQKQKTKYSQY